MCELEQEHSTYNLQGRDHYIRVQDQRNDEMEQVIGREQDLEVGPKAWEFFIFFESGANVSTLSRQILRVSTSENTPPNLRSQTSSLLLPILSAKVRCKNGCFGSQVSLYQDLNVNPDHDSTTTKKQ